MHISTFPVKHGNVTDSSKLSLEGRGKHIGEELQRHWKQELHERNQDEW